MATRTSKKSNSTIPIAEALDTDIPPLVKKTRSRSSPRPKQEEAIGEFQHVIRPCGSCLFCIVKEDRKNLSDVQGVCVWHSADLRMSDIEDVSSEVRQSCLTSGDKFIPRMSNVDPITYAYWSQGSGSNGFAYRVKAMRLQTWLMVANSVLLIWLLIHSFIK